MGVLKRGLVSMGSILLSNIDPKGQLSICKNNMGDFLRLPIWGDILNHGVLLFACSSLTSLLRAVSCDFGQWTLIGHVASSGFACICVEGLFPCTFTISLRKNTVLAMKNEGDRRKRGLICSLKEA